MLNLTRMDYKSVSQQELKDLPIRGVALQKMAFG